MLAGWRGGGGGEERLAGAVRLCFSVLMTHLTVHREKALRQRWGVTVCVCVRACASASLLLVFLVQCIHVKRTFSVNSSLFGARVINHSVTAVVVLGAFVQVWLLWEQLPSPTNQLWFCCAERSGQANGRTQERRAAPCVLFTCLEKKGKKDEDFSVLIVHTCTCVCLCEHAGFGVCERVSARRTIRDVSSGFSCEKGNDGDGSSVEMQRRGMPVCNQSAAVECAWKCSGLQTAAQPLTHCCVSASPLTHYHWFPYTLPAVCMCACENKRQREIERSFGNVSVCVLSSFPII